jgi:hypothetical protein
MAIDQRHDTSQSVESWIFKLFFLLQSRQPLLDFERFYTQREFAALFREQAVSEDAVVTFDCGMRLWLDRFCSLDQFVLCIVQYEVAKCECNNGRCFPHPPRLNVPPR